MKQKDIKLAMWDVQVINLIKELEPEPNYHKIMMIFNGYLKSLNITDRRRKSMTSLTYDFYDAANWTKPVHVINHVTCVVTSLLEGHA